MPPTAIQKGDLVWVAECATPYKYAGQCEALVLSAAEGDSFALYIKGRGRSAWYYGKHLTRVESGGLGVLQRWQAEDAITQKTRGDLDWIFSNGDAVVSAPYGATASALAACLGRTDLHMGSSESAAYYRNAACVLALAEPFLREGDKGGWLAYCERLKAEA